MRHALIVYIALLLLALASCSTSLPVRSNGPDAAWRAQLGAAGRAHAAQHMEREAVLQRFESFLMGDNKNG